MSGHYTYKKGGGRTIRTATQRRTATQSKIVTQIRKKQKNYKQLHQEKKYYK